MAVIRYISEGKPSPGVKVAVSMNNGRSWQEKTLLPGQSFPIPPHATNLLMDNVPYSPDQNWTIRGGRVGK